MKVFWLKTKQLLNRFVGAFKTKKLSLIDDGNLIRLLKSIGEFENINNRKYVCVGCGQSVSLENFGALYRDNGHYGFLCNEHNCLVNHLDQ